MWRLLSLLNVVLLVSGVGCGGPAGPPQMTVTGKISNAGKPVTEGSVVFLSKMTGEVVAAPLTADGTFTVSNAMSAGDYSVAVQPPPSEEVAGAPTSTPPKTYPEIPEKFRSDVTSPLVTSLAAGENRVEFDLATAK